MNTKETGTCWDNFQLRIQNESFNEAGNLHSSFLRRGILSGAMHCPQFQIGGLIRPYLANDSFGSILLARVQSSPVGTPILLPGYHHSTVDLQTLLYIHLWISLLDVDATNEQSVHYVDFGGGYGLFSRAITLLNHRATVDVVDLPVVSEVQRLYHKQTLSLQQRSRVNYTDENVQVPNRHLFHATYSLSETMLPARERLVRSLVASSDRFLIVYQDAFRDTAEPIDNHAWFNGPFQSLVPQHTIKCAPLPFHSGSHLIYGRRRSNDQTSEPSGQL